MIQYRMHKKKGNALTIALFCGILIIAFLTIYLSYTNNEFINQRILMERTSSMYLAEAGIEEGFYLYSFTSEEELIDLSPFEGTIAGKNTLGSYKVEYLGRGIFQATGTASSKRSYTIEVQIDEVGKVVRWEERIR